MSSGNFRVAALVSLYKAERFIKGRIEDLAQQTLFKRGELEIIFIDSASPENEFETVQQFCDKNPNIKYIRTKFRETLYRAWNRGIEISKAPLLINANADDRLCPEALEKLADTLDGHQKAGFAYGDAYLSSVENETFEEASNGTVFQSQDYFGPDLLCHQFLGHQVMWRRSVHSQVGLFSPEFKAAGDYEFMLRGAIRARGVHLKEPLGLLLRRSDSITFNDGTMNREVAQVKARFRNQKHALELYRVEGVEVEKHGYAEACYIDLGNRALAYFPQWGGGRPDADFDFAQLCYRWALESASRKGGLEEVRVWATLNSFATQVLSGEKEVEECSSLIKDHKLEVLKDSSSRVEGGVALVWPDLGLKDSSLCRDLVLGNFSREETTLDGNGKYRKVYLHPYSYWRRLTGLDTDYVARLKNGVESKSAIMIWGASARGILMAKVLNHFGIEIAGFIDNDPSKAGSFIGKFPIEKFEPNKVRDKDWKVVLAVSDQQRGFVLDQLDGCGMRDILLPVQRDS